MPHDDLLPLIAGASATIEADIRDAFPRSAPALAAWMRQLAGSDAPADYFCKPHAFPMLQLPWWLEQTLRPAPDLALQRDLARSTMCGYYYIRMIDNVMDGHATVEPGLLPALSFFHTAFQTPYMAYFPAGHAFWDDFRAIWHHAADCTIADGQATTIDLAHFRQISGQKVAAGAIPLAAVCAHAGQPERFAPWRAFLDGLGAWHQLFNDLLSWRKDLAAGTPTLLLSEALRQQRPGEPVAAWMLRAGIPWALDLLARWLTELQAQAEALGSPALAAYLVQRERMLADQAATLQQGAQALQALAGLLAAAPAGGEA